MALSSTYSAMINEHLTYDLLMEEFKTQSWLMQNCNIKKDWQSGKIPIPFQSSSPSSVRLGAMTAATDIAPGNYVRGEITSLPEAYGSLQFFEKDLSLHGKISEQNFIKLLPDHIEQLIKYMKQSISISVLNSGALLTTTSTGSSAGVATVSNTERLCLGQKLTIVGEAATVSGYVRTINKNTNSVSFFDARTGGAAVDLSLATGAEVIAGNSIYLDGGDAENFSSLIGQILPLADGGTANIFGVAKLSSPYTQAVSIDGDGITAANIIEKIFDALTTARQKGADPQTILMDYTNFGSCIKKLESGSGAYRHVNAKASPYGYSEVEVGSVTGDGIKLVAIREMTPGTILGINKKYIDFHCAPKSFFEILESPDGLKYFTVRDVTAGYSYITDLRLSGEFVYRAPYDAMAIHTISY